MLRILVDEDLSRLVAPALVRAGIDAVDVRDVGLRSKPDREVFSYAQSDHRVLLTADQGFANILAYPPGTHAGIVVVWFPPSVHYLAMTSSIVSSLLSLPEGDVLGNLVTVEPGRVRVRSASTGLNPP